MKKYILLFVICLFCSSYAISQTVGVTDFMRLNPYSNFNNPAYFIPYKGYVSLPFISNINLSYYNSGLLYNSLFEIQKGGQFNMKKVLNSLSKNNWFNVKLNAELIGFGLQIQNHFLSFNYRFVFDERFRFSQDLFGFLLQGHSAYTKESPAILEIEPNLNLYSEMCFGLQSKVTDRLYIGVRPKLLFGAVNLNTENFYAKIYTDPNDNTIYGKFDIDFNMASAVPFHEIDADGNISFTSKYLFNYTNVLRHIFFSKNVGFAIDFGAVFRINKQIRVSASVTDLGFIRWRTFPLNMRMISVSDDQEFFYFTADQFQTFFKDRIFMNFDEIINKNFTLTSVHSYKTMLTSKVMFDGYFDLTPSNRFILQLKGYIFGKKFLPQFTVAYNGSFFNIIDVVVSYSIMKQSFTNFGVGAGLRMGPAHLYFGADNLFSFFNLLSTKRMSVTAGLLIDFPITKKVKESDLKSLFNNNL